MSVGEWARSALSGTDTTRSLWFEPLHHHLAAIGRQSRAGDQAGVIGGEEHDATRDLLRLAEATQGNQRQDVLLQHILGHSLDHLGCNVARADRVYGDAGACALLRQRLGEAK